MGLSPTRENTLNSHLKSTPPDLLLVDRLHISVTLRHQEDDSGLRQSQNPITKRDHAFQPRPRCFPALRKQRHVRQRRLRIRRRGADERYALPEFRALQSVVCELGLQLHQPGGQVCPSTAESEEAPERLHHLDQRRAQAAGSAQPRPGEHGSE